MVFFYQLSRLYLGTNELQQTNDVISSSNVTDYVTENFPPTFISDGNHGSFYDQAFVLNAQLIKLGVPVTLNYFPESVAGQLGHGFEEGDSEMAQLTFNHFIQFLESQN